MRTLDGAAVQTIIALFEPPPSQADSVRLAAMIGSWPELLPHLMLCRETISVCPEIDQAIRKQAAAFRVGKMELAPPREVKSERLALSEAALEDALRAVLHIEQDRAGALGAAHDALRACTAARMGTDFDLHLRISVGSQ